MGQKGSAVADDTFPEYFKYDETGETSGTYPVKVDGITGIGTVKALIRAIQICGNQLPPDGVWGRKTASVYTKVYSGSGETDKRLNYILQDAFYCKGYDPLGFDGLYGNGVRKAIQKFQSGLAVHLVIFLQMVRMREKRTRRSFMQCRVQ